MKLALIGKEISHSLSPEIYSGLLGLKLERYSLLDYSDLGDIPSVASLLHEYDGLSITAPYKNNLFNQCDYLTNAAQSSNAVNCLKLIDGKVHGENTDYLALEALLPDLVSQFSSIAILGNGTMKNLCSLVFDKLRIKYMHYFRKKNGDLSFIDLSNLTEKIFVLNTCSRSFLFQGKLPLNSIYYDLNYLIAGQDDIFKKSRIQYIDGKQLLQLQAKFALKFWESP